MEAFMRRALELARHSSSQGEIPVACVFVHNGQALAEAWNMTNETKNATKHCEIVAIDEILKTHPPSILQECELYVTCEPCIMCASALEIIGIKKVYFGCYNERFGGNGSILSVHEGKYESVGGFFAEEAIKIFKDFYERGNPNAPPEKRHRPVAE
ncbi:TAD2 [Blepharisma stoltei]|uniref:CMP/dCMP-type deaminase domain-containing protein n=1 Tax=Blepharisma stoltei TaxID=1481888 RepID=A0AAU9JWI8_9CILI|nr:unnamed protein product [Blepharisma stoltei]